MDEKERSRLSKSSRVSDKVMEYYLKYGKDRELDKFMRLLSDESQKSSGSNTTSASSGGSAKLGGLPCLFHERGLSSEEDKLTSSGKERLVPIEVDCDYNEKRRDDEDDRPGPSPKTPPQNKQVSTDTKHSATQTPESAAKCHKRLEWDSLGDVGYRKSKSTSNISIVERMLLREFFEVSTSAGKNTNSSENDVRMLEQEIADLGTLRKLFLKPKAVLEFSSYGLTPLASSTHIEKLKQQPTSKPEVHTVGTSTSLVKEKSEKFAQTSTRRPEMSSQEGHTIGTNTSLIKERIEQFAQTSMRRPEMSSQEVNTSGTNTSLVKEKTEKYAQTSTREQEMASQALHTTGTNTSMVKEKTEKYAQTSAREPEMSSQEVHTIGTNTSLVKEKTEKYAQTSAREPEMASQALHTTGTNTSMTKEKTEKYAQTSAREPEMTSQEVQVSLTPPGISSLLGSSAAPSSFEYRSQISTNSSESKSIQSSLKQLKRPQAGEIHCKTKKPAENLRKRKTLEIKNDINVEEDVCERLKNMFINWNCVMEEDKENASSTSTCSTESSSPRIDLGIQLICGIMKTNTIEQKQKKRLVRNIVKRITKIANSCELDVIVSKTASLIQSTSDSQKERFVTKQLRSMEDQNKCAKLNKDDPPQKTEIQSYQQEESLGLGSTQNPNIETKKSDKKTQLRTKSISATVSETTIDPSSSTSIKTSAESSRSLQHLPASTPNATNISLKINPPEKKSTTTTSTGSSSSTSVEQLPLFDISLNVSKTASGGELISAVVTQPELKDHTSTTTISSSLSSSSSSKNVCTQKSAAIIPPQRSTEATKNTENMQEWLNPMTQSEVEFDFKKRTIAPTKKDHKEPKSGSTSERNAGLNWIDSEIERLQKLRNIILIDEKAGSPKILPLPLQENSNSAESIGNLYDTVYSEPSHIGHRSSGGESRQIVADIPDKKVFTHENTAPKKSNIRNVEKKDAQQQFSSKQPIQRSKIDTPSSTTGSVSVGSFVRQRKQEFLDHYKNQKLHHYDQIMHKYYQGPSTSAAAAASSAYHNNYIDCYSVPVPIPKSYYTYPPTQQVYRELQFAPGTMTSKRESSNNVHKIPRTISSELSVPMGSYNTLSTPTSTTTHQYDLATTEVNMRTANMGSQTERSVTRSRPIYETRCMSPYHAIVPHSNYVACTCGPMVRTVCIQARPQGVSYTLQFPSKSSQAKEGSSGESQNSTSVEYQTLDKAEAPSLQAALQHGHPEFMMQAKKRKSILNRIQQLRLERERELRAIADDNTSLNSLDRRLEILPPPVTEKLNVFPNKQMKALTNKRVAKLPEVLAKQELKREERYKRSNRLLREVFNRRLRERVRKGRLTFKHGLTLI